LLLNLPLVAWNGKKYVLYHISTSDYIEVVGACFGRMSTAMKISEARDRIEQGFG